MVKIFDIKTAKELMSFSSHEKSVTCVAFFYDSKHAISGGDDSNLYLIDMETKRCIPTLTANNSPITCLGVTKDDKFVIYGSQDGFIWIGKIEAQAGFELNFDKKISANNNAGIILDISPDSKLVLYGADDKSMRIMDFATEKEIYKSKQATETVTSVAFSKNGRYVASGDRKNNVIIYDIILRHIVSEFKASKPVTNIFFSQKSQFLICVSEDFSLRVLELNKSNEFSLKYTWIQSKIRATAFSPDGSKIYSGTEEGTINIYDTNTSKIIYPSNMQESIKIDKGLLNLALSPDGKYLLAGKKSIFLVDLGNPEKKKEFRIHSDNIIRCLAFSPDGKMFISGGEDKTAKITLIENEELIYECGPFLESVCAADFSPDGLLVATGGGDEILRVHSIKEKRQIISQKCHDQTIRMVKFSFDSRWILSGSFDETVKLFEAKTGNEIKVFRGHSNSVNAVAFSPDAKYVLSGGEDKQLLLFKVETGNLVRKFTNFTKSIRALAFSPKSPHIIAGSEDGKLAIYDINEQYISHSYSRHSESLVCVAVSPDEKMLATSSLDKTIKLFDVKRGFLIRTLICEEESPTIAFSPDGFYLLAGGNDNIMRLFNVHFGIFVKTYTGHQEYINSVCFSRDGKFVMSGSADRTIRIYNTISSEQIKVLPPKDENKKEENAIEPKPDNLKNANDYLFSDLTSTFFHCVSFSSKSDSVFAAGFDKLIRKYDFEKEIVVQVYKGHKKPVTTFSLTHDDKYLVSGGEDSLIIMFSVFDGKQIYSIPQFHTGIVKSVMFSTDGDKFISVGNEGKMGIFERNEGVALKLFPDHPNALNSVAFFDDNKRVVCGGDNEGAQIYNAETKEEIPFFSFSSKVKSISTSPDGRYVAVSNEELENIFIYEIQSGQLKTELKGEKKTLAVKFSMDGTKILAGGEDLKLRLYSFSSEKTVINPDAVITTQHSNEITCLEFSNDQKSFWSGGNDSLICLSFNKDTAIHSSKLLKFSHHTGPIISMFLLQSNKIHSLLSAAADDTIQILDVKSSNPRVHVKLSKEGIIAVDVSPDWKYILCGCKDKIIRLFDYETGSELKSYIGHSDDVNTVKFSSNLNRIISGSKDKCLKVFDRDSGAETQSISFEHPILNSAVCSRRDTVCLGSEGGFQIISRLFNQTCSVTESLNILMDCSNLDTNDFEFKASDLQMVPYPLILNKLHILSSHEDNKYCNLEGILKKFANTPKEESLPLLESCIFSNDSLGFSPWDYWIDLVDNKHKTYLNKKLVQLIISRYITGISGMKNKKQFLQNVIKNFPSKLSLVLDAFLNKIDEVNLRRTVKSKLPVFTSVTPSPCPRVIKKEYKNILSQRELAMKEYFNLAVKISQIAPEEIKDLLEDLATFPVSHSLFKSESLIMILDYIWDSETRKSFLRQFYGFLLFILLVIIQFIWIFPERQSQTGKPYAQAYQRGGIFFDILICSILLLVYLPKLFSRIYYQKKALDEGNKERKSDNSFKKTGSFNSSKKSKNISLYLLPLLRLGGLLKSLPPRVWLDFLFIITGVFSTLIDVIWLFKLITDQKIDDTSALSVKIILSVFFFSCWIKLLDYARGFKMTSALIRLLIRVLHDMFGFLVVLFFMITGMAFATFIIQNNYDSQNPWEYFQKFYYMLMGDFNDYNDTPTKSDQDLYFIILLGATVLIVVVMLNLLIAIISDSFEKVMALEKQAEVFEKLQLIIEKKRSMGKEGKGSDDSEKKKTYLFELIKEETMVEENIEERLRSKIDNIEGKIDKNLWELKKAFERSKKELAKTINAEMKVNMEEEIKKLLKVINETKMRTSAIENK